MPNFNFFEKIKIFKKNLSTRNIFVQIFLFFYNAKIQEIIIAKNINPINREI